MIAARPLVRLAVVTLCVMAASAGAASGEAGPGGLVPFLGFEVFPRGLSATKPSPVRLKISGRYRTQDGSQVPALKELRLEGDRHLAVDPTDVPSCDLSEFGPRVDRSGSCPESVLGSGTITVGTAFAGDRVIPTTSRLTLWKTGRLRGGARALGYAFLTSPVVAELLMPVKIRRVEKGRLGWQAVATVPKIAGGAGSITDFRLTIGRKLLSATCAGYFRFDSVSSFADGTRLQERFVRPCTVAEPDVRK